MKSILFDKKATFFQGGEDAVRGCTGAPSAGDSLKKTGRWIDIV